MNERIEIVPTSVPGTKDMLTDAAQTISAFAPSIHVDIDDGIFVPYLTWPYTAAGTFQLSDLPIPKELFVEIHLMVQTPRQIGIELARLGAARIIAHVESFDSSDDARGALDAWKQNGAKEVGLGMLFDTSLEVMQSLSGACDVVQLMSIATIGTQSIPFDPRAPERIAAFHEKYPNVRIGVDGGVGESNIAALVKAGATRLSVGSAIMKTTDPAASYKKLFVLANAAV